MRYKSLVGQRFGRLTVLEREENKGKNIRYRCRCDCGRETVVYASSLRNDNTRSCGCLKEEKDLLIQAAHLMMTDDICGVRAIEAWLAIRTGKTQLGRVRTKGSTEFCEEWEFLDNFLNWAIGHGYSSTRDHLLRWDIEKPWSPENCFWGTYHECLKHEGEEDI